MSRHTGIMALSKEHISLVSTPSLHPTVHVVLAAQKLKNRSARYRSRKKYKHILKETETPGFTIAELEKKSCLLKPEVEGRVRCLDDDQVNTRGCRKKHASSTIKKSYSHVNFHKVLD